MGGLIYTKFTVEMLKTCVRLDISKNAMRLWIYYELNANIKKRITHPKTDDEIAEEIGSHRTTILRARAELEEKGIIKPTRQTREHSNVYHLLHDNSDAQVATAAEINNRKALEKQCAKERSNIEDTLGRRLTKNEIKKLKEKYGI